MNSVALFVEKYNKATASVKSCFAEAYAFYTSGGDATQENPGEEWREGANLRYGNNSVVGNLSEIIALQYIANFYKDWQFITESDLQQQGVDIRVKKENWKDYINISVKTAAIKDRKVSVKSEVAVDLCSQGTITRVILVDPFRHALVMVDRELLSKAIISESTKEGERVAVSFDSLKLFVKGTKSILARF